MVINYILDTSVAVKWFSSDNEHYLLQAQKLFEDLRLGKIQILTLDLMLIELTNALIISKKADILTTIASCQILLQSPIKFTPLSPKMLFEAMKLTTIYNLTIYDSLYIALAIQEKAKVITADKIITKVEKYSLSISEYC